LLEGRDRPHFNTQRAVNVRLGRRPGAFVAFLDAFTEETILKIECSLADVNLITFHLYDKEGKLVADSSGARSFPEGVEVTAHGEVLLSVPCRWDESIKYRLYSSNGALLTASDGLRTQIFGGVRVEGNKQLSGRPPGARSAPEVASADQKEGNIIDT
jgi:hypothetical protein